jgi:hypothetical protein
MRALLVALSILVALLGVLGGAGTGVARGEPAALCRRGAVHHGAPIDLDVNHADLRDVLRLLADTGHSNVVMPDDIAGKVTLRLVRVAWDAAACAVAAAHGLVITVDGNLLLVTRRARYTRTR